MIYSFAIFVLLSIAALSVIFMRKKTNVIRASKVADVEREITENKRLNIVGKKMSRWSKFRINAEASLEGSKLGFQQYLYILVGLSIAGLLIGVFWGNPFLAVVLAAGLPTVPGWLLNIRMTRYKQWLSEQIETVINIITNTYMSTDSIVEAVKKNLPNIEMPLKKIFQDFVTSKTYIDSSDIRNIRRMKETIDNPFWQEWCDILILCQHDRLHKQSLMPVVKKMADVRQINEELATETAALYKDYISVTALVLGNIPMLRFIQRDWYDILTTTLVGQIIIALTFLVAILGTAYVIKINKPANLS